MMDVAEAVRGGGPVVLAALMPHAPVLVPAVGGMRVGVVASTVKAMREVARRVQDAKPGSLVLVSPHSPRQREAFGIWQGERFHGSLVQFGADAADTEIDLPADRKLRDAIEACCHAAGIPTWAIPGQPLDHGAVVPLCFLQEAGWDGPTVLLSLNYPGEGMLEELGAAIAEAGANLGRRIAFIASGDMSHRLQPGAPAGYHPEAWQSDERFIELLRAGERAGLRRLDPSALEIAAEDAVDSTRIAFAATRDDPGGCEVLSYEGPFGVGYGVAILHEAP
jgi:MEMO1 family protein